MPHRGYPLLRKAPHRRLGNLTAVLTSSGSNSSRSSSGGGGSGNSGSSATKVALISGAGSGIGLSCAERLAGDGYIVFGSDLKPSAPNGFPGSWLQCDVTDEERQAEVVAQILAQHHRLDVLVCAAGIGLGGKSISQTSLRTWQKVQAVNMEGTFLSCRAALPPMVAQGSGSIVTIASVQGIEVSNDGAAAYSASKAGVIMFTKNIATEYGSVGIRANSVCPGCEYRVTFFRSIRSSHMHCLTHS